MCGRYALTVSARVLAELFELEIAPEFEARYNIAPTQTVPIVRRNRDDHREMSLARWGLIPSWASDAKMGARMINARAETVASKPAFRSAAKRRRCLVPADGFFEWQRVGDAKQPHLIRFSDARPFAFAGLWETWQPPTDVPVASFTIITTRPNSVVARVHDRMPVILPGEAFAEWLGPDELASERLAELLAPHPADEMEAFPVARTVGNPRNDSPECVAPLAQSSLW